MRGIERKGKSDVHGTKLMLFLHPVTQTDFSSLWQLTHNAPEETMHCEVYNGVYYVSSQKNCQQNVNVVPYID